MSLAKTASFVAAALLSASAAAQTDGVVRTIDGRQLEGTLSVGEDGVVELRQQGGVVRLDLAELGAPTPFAPSMVASLKERAAAIDEQVKVVAAGMDAAPADGDDARAAVAVLGDFRSGRLGNVALEGPPPPREIILEEPVEVAPTEPVEAAESDFDRRMSEGDFAGW